MCQEPLRPKANQQVKAIVTITETARIMRSSPTKGSGSGSGSVGGSPAKYAACHCRCTPEDFTHAQLSPDKMEHQTCKLLESPKQTATTVQQKQEDEQLSLMLIGLAQFAPAAKLCGQERIKDLKEDINSTPTIAVVPPTPDSVLTKTSTHVWDNSGCSSNGGGTGTSTTSTATTTTKQPRQAAVNNKFLYTLYIQIYIYPRYVYTYLLFIFTFIFCKPHVRLEVFDLWFFDILHDTRGSRIDHRCIEPFEIEIAKRNDEFK